MPGDELQINWRSSSGSRRKRTREPAGLLQMYHYGCGREALPTRGLAAAVSLMSRDRGGFCPRRQILIYPALASDHSENSPYPSVRENGTGYLLTARRVRDYMALYRSSDEDLTNPYFAPLHAASLGEQPDTLLITAEYCPLRDEGEAYGRRLREEGGFVEIHRLPDALHGYFSLPVRFSLVKQTYGIMNRFLERRHE